VQPSEVSAAHPGGHVREHADPACADALHDRQRRKRERRRVRREPAGLHREAEQPAAVAEEQPQRLNRAAQREGREQGGGVVLARVRDVGERRRNRCQDQPDDHVNGH
jgi:hypothetical protein